MRHQSFFYFALLGTITLTGGPALARQEALEPYHAAHLSLAASTQSAKAPSAADPTQSAKSSAAADPTQSVTSSAAADPTLSVTSSSADSTPSVTSLIDADGAQSAKSMAPEPVPRAQPATALPQSADSLPSAEMMRSELDQQKFDRKKEKELDELSHSKRTVRRGNASCLTWLPSQEPPKAVLLCVHGLGLHNASYADFGLRMAKLGYAIYAIDVRGFGSFMEAQGREQVDFDGCLADIQSTLKVLHRAHKGLPVFLLGESMGGAIALRATAIYPNLIDGLISSVPANDRFKQNHTRLSVAIHLLESPNKPFNVGKGIISQATDKQDLRDQWTKDPLNRLNLSANELLQFQHFMNQNHKCAKLIQVTPVLFVQGSRDKLVRPKGTVELFNELATKDRELALIANGEHLIFEENQFTDEGINKVSAWIDAHLGSTQSQNVAPSTSAQSVKGE